MTLKSDILALIQKYEEIGTVSSTEEYIRELSHIKREIEVRMDNAEKFAPHCHSIIRREQL